MLIDSAQVKLRPYFTLIYPKQHDFEDCPEEQVVQY